MLAKLILYSLLTQFNLHPLCEQRMKPVKLLLKNCMNIGSEAAAENSAFIFSLIESCKLNGIDPQNYLKHLFECILHGKDCDKKALLP